MVLHEGQQRTQQGRCDALPAPGSQDAAPGDHERRKGGVVIRAFAADAQGDAADDCVILDGEDAADLPDGHCRRALCSNSASGSTGSPGSSSRHRARMKTWRAAQASGVAPCGSNGFILIMLARSRWNPVAEHPDSTPWQDQR